MNKANIDIMYIFLQLIKWAGMIAQLISYKNFDIFCWEEIRF